MKRDLKITADGSSSLYSTHYKELYHSKYGAIKEARHIFLRNALDVFSCKEKIDIIEMGYGTGLNAFLSFLQGRKKPYKIHYTGIEKHPLNQYEWEMLNYLSELNAESYKDVYCKFFSSPWGVPVEISSDFLLTKLEEDLVDFRSKKRFDIVYFDAFSPEAQAELWSEAVFTKLYDMMSHGGLLVTYCSKTQVRRRLQASGFIVKKQMGPPGKREIVQAFKP